MQQISSGWFATLRSPAVRVRWGLAPSSAGDSAAAAPVEVPRPVAAVARLCDGDEWGFVSDFDTGDDWCIWHRFLGSRHFTSFIWTCATWRCSILQHRYLPARVCMKWKLARCCPCTLFVAISDSWRHVLAFLSWKPRLLDVHSVTDVYRHTLGQYVALAHITEVWKIRLIEIVGKSYDVQFEVWQDFVLQHSGFWMWHVMTCVTERFAPCRPSALQDSTST